MKTDYNGIDYGLGKTNADTNGVRYGVISQHSINPDALEDIYNGENLSFQYYQEEVKKAIRSALEDYVSKHQLEGAVESAFDAVEQEVSDNYQSDEDQYRYEKDGYVIETSSLGLMILKSPFFTYAQFCSPCVPGAGNLDSPLYEMATPNKTYCLGPDWFEDNKCPYTVYPLETK